MLIDIDAQGGVGCLVTRNGILGVEIGDTERSGAIVPGPVREDVLPCPVRRVRNVYSLRKGCTYRLRTHRRGFLAGGLRCTTGEKHECCNKHDEGHADAGIPVKRFHIHS